MGHLPLRRGPAYCLAFGQLMPRLLLPPSTPPELPRRLLGRIDIDHEPVLPQAIPETTWRTPQRRSGYEIVLKHGPQRLDTRLIKRVEKTTQRAAMGETAPIKDCHKGAGKWRKTIIKGLECSFTTEGIPNEYCHKINQIVVIKTSASKLHLRLDELHETIGFEDLRYNGDFTEPTRGGRDGFGGNLDVD